MSTPLRKALALALCAQPIFWTSNVALAQSFQAEPGDDRRRGVDQEISGEMLRQDGARGTTRAPSGLGSSQGTTAVDPLDRADPAGVSGPSSAAVPGEAGGADPNRLERPAGTSGLPPVDQPIDPDTYRVGPGDVLELNFWGLQNQRLRATVDLEGRTFVPRLGYLALGGKTLGQARAALRETVARYYPRLSFDVSLAEPRIFMVQAVGDVARPGSYPARAVDRVATFLARTGGLGKKASRRRIEVRRRDGAVVPVDLELFQLTGDVKHNPTLLDGDVVQVPFQALAARVDGAGNRPGRYELTGARDLAELVSLAGGLAPAATRQMPVAVVRRSSSDAQDLTLIPFAEGGGLPATAIQQDDMVRFPSFDELQRSVLVVGALAGVAAPEDALSTKRLAFVEGDTVRTLLERVGGVGPLADLTGSYLQRDAGTVPLDLYALVMLKDLKADRPVQLGDTLVVPFRRRSILVEGAVATPGQYPYNPKFGVEQYLALAGGRNRFAQGLDEVRLVTPNGETQPYRAGLPVEPGSALVVPERNFSRAELVQIGISIASIILSGTALLITAKKL
jgi:protein involved in polysaccharide export with SLBB domain